MWLPSVPSDEIRIIFQKQTIMEKGQVFIISYEMATKFAVFLGYKGYNVIIAVNL